MAGLLRRCTGHYLGYSNWRLPTMMDTGTPGCNYSTTGGTDCGYNVQTGSATTMVYSEMASLWYDTLGNKAYYDTSGNGPQPGWGLSNTGPFSNMQPNFYWSGSEFDSSGAWHFHFGNGFQNTFSKSSFNFACAVRSEG